MPVGNDAATNCPLAFVSTVRVNFVPSFVMLTVAPVITAPV
jgi:hypothetical protein